MTQLKLRSTIAELSTFPACMHAGNLILENAMHYKIFAPSLLHHQPGRTNRAKSLFASSLSFSSIHIFLLLFTCRNQELAQARY